MTNVEVTVSHLVMSSPHELRPSTSRADGIDLHREPPDHAAQVARECYRIVGSAWHWTDRLHWDSDMWQEYLDADDCQVWTARQQGELVGYCLMASTGDAVDIRYFGLVPDRIGQGIGGWLLTRMVEHAWSLGPTRVTLNTCSLDGPNALSNYQSRGFRVTREEKLWRKLNP